jgi:hypothetical protein
LNIRRHGDGSITMISIGAAKRRRRVTKRMIVKHGLLRAAGWRAFPRSR